MNNIDELLSIINDLSDKIEAETINYSQVSRTFDELKEFITNNKLGIWNNELEGFDRYE